MPPASHAAKPDFAFPEKVEKTALADLSTALKAGDDPAIVNAVIRYALSHTVIDPEESAAVLTRITDTRTEVSSPATQAMLDILSAHIYRSIYLDNKWTYDRRDIPLEPRADDCRQWSGDQYYEVISGLVNSALTHRDILAATPVGEYASSITIDADSKPYYPTLLDFVAVQGIDCLQPFASDQQLLADHWLTDEDLTPLLAYNAWNKRLRDLLAIYNIRVDAHPDVTPARIRALLDRMTFLQQNLFENNTDVWNDALFTVYDRCGRTDCATELLLGLDINSNRFLFPWIQQGGSSDRMALYTRIKAACDAHSGYFTAPQLRHMMQQMTQPVITARIPTVIARNVPVNVDVEIDNARTAALHIYRIDNPGRIGPDETRVQASTARTHIGTVTVPVPSDRPVIYHDTVTVSITLPEYGIYVIIPETDGVTSKEKYLDIFRCSDLATVTSSITDDMQAIVVSNRSGAPVADATVHILSGGYRAQTPMTKVQTDTDGIARISGYNYGNIYATSGDDRFAPTTYYGFSTLSSAEKESVDTEALVYTGLPLYHPGDSIHGVLVAYEYGYRGRRLLADSTVDVELRDANYQSVGTAQLVTDSFGRAEFSFDIPSTGLTGDYRLIVSYGGISIGYHSVPVSDYKLPTYEVTVDSIANNLRLPEANVVIRGNAKYYSGFPVADAAVRVTLCGIQRSWWRTRRTPAFYDTEAVTDADGNFVITITRDIIDMCPVTGATIEASLAVTSDTGETCIAETSFAVGKPYAITSDIPGVADSTAPVAVKVGAVGADGKDAEIDVRVTVSRDGEAVRTIDAKTPVRTLDLSGLAAGRYAVAVEAADPALADTIPSRNIILYQPQMTECPVDTALFVPRKVYNIPAGASSADIVYGSTDSDPYILMTTVRAGRITDRRWLTPGRGMHTLTVSDIAADDETTVTLTRVSAGRFYSEDVVLHPAALDNRLEVAIESFRDKVTSGDTERWRITVRDTEGAAGRTPLMMTMYSKALTTLVNTPWRIAFNMFRPATLGMNMNTGSEMLSMRIPVPEVEERIIEAPVLNTYGIGFNGIRNLHIRGTRRMYKSSMVTNEASVMCDMAAPTVMESAVEEYEEEPETGALGVSKSTDGGEAKSEDNEAQYRAVEGPSAFFAPMLTTGADGSLTYSFTVPDANTTWQMYAMAYTDKFLSTVTSRDIVSSKPVMVNANLPRFVRQGDYIRLMSSVMNNSDAEKHLDVDIQILDAVSGNLLSSSSDSMRLAPMANSVVVHELTAPAGIPAVIFRIKASDGSFTDGEQKLIPVLEASQPVIESTPFYLAPDSVVTEIPLPGRHADSRVTLQFTENIAWEVVTALPGLRRDDSRTSNAAMARLFSAATARGILRDNPEIAAALREWTAGDRSDSTLTSMLSRNNDLKVMMLNATPWVQAAASDTERMTRLTLLFDNSLIDNTIAESLKLLSDLQNGDGGWRWIAESNESSTWSTYNILEGFADLHRLGYTPDDSRIAPMVTKALKYIDADAVHDYKENPRGDFRYYTWLRMMLNDPAPSTAANAVITATIQRILSEWKTDDLVNKAIDAVILEKRNYHSTARQVIESLRQYARSDAQHGMWWPRLGSQNRFGGHQTSSTSIILDAFEAVEPDCADIDMIRQWLVINKTTQDWGSGVQTSQIITSILSSGTKWTVPVQGVTITVDGNAVEIPKSESRTGNFVTDITPLTSETPGAIVIDKPGRYPSFGAVIDQYTGVMRDIRAAGCEAVAITKRHLVKSGTTWVESDTARVGDIVKISLTVTVNQGLDYVAIVDNRAACLEPVEQLPAPIFAEGLYFYRENRDSATNIFVSRLPKGVYILEYEMKVNNAGEFASGIATLQSQYAPAMTAHSGGTVLTVNE